MKTVKIVTASGKEYSIPQKSIAHINSKKCYKMKFSIKFKI